MDDLLLLILCSPSGAGKTTLTKHLLARVAGPDVLRLAHDAQAARERDRRRGLPLRRSRALRRAGRRAARSRSGRRCTATSTARASTEIERARARGQARDRVRHRLPGRAADQGEAPGRDRRLHPPAVDGGARARCAARATETRRSRSSSASKGAVEIEHYGFFDYLVVNDDLEPAKGDARSRSRAPSSPAGSATRRSPSGSSPIALGQEPFWESRSGKAGRRSREETLRFLPSRLLPSRLPAARSLRGRSAPARACG